MTGGQAIASASELKTPDEFDSLIDRLSESLGIDSSAGKQASILNIRTVGDTG